jgi:signal transduction histidine kinase
MEVLKILEESKETIANNKLLKDKSQELTRLTSQLKVANLELIQKDKQKDEFLDTVAHELKTPITGIRGAAELLLDDADEMPPEIRDQFLRNILQDSDRFARLIHNILDFEKLSENREELMLKRINFKDTVRRVVSSVSQVAATANVKIEVTTQRDAYAEYDDDRIIQVLTNLISNGIKFAAKENGIVWVQYRIYKKQLKVNVSDNGKGVPAEDFDFIFDKFYQSKNQNTIKPEGSGLGLAITKRIIDRHFGTIKVTNETNGGANFIFEIPINQS